MLAHVVYRYGVMVYRNRGVNRGVILAWRVYSGIYAIERGGAFLWRVYRAIL